MGTPYFTFDTSYKSVPLRALWDVRVGVSGVTGCGKPLLSFPPNFVGNLKLIKTKDLLNFLPLGIGPRSSGMLHFTLLLWFGNQTVSVQSKYFDIEINTQP